ncbi:MAG TPA: entericidin A/B family lipoprotein [Methylotenera sp.]|nr:entericidin A/B family lipoprotein [Methylotenera sp.]
MNKLFVLAALGFTLVLTGCNTWHGFGKDLEKAGDKIQNSPNN